ncbi:hypothetical protein [uncultured Megasphaera sp.]|uniref:hypothetical protein n=1 Tax=uncultured Megasphaera sp. TaxID=165188 RepID=UPI002593B85D|nr:hypothetical protein [uncultured Megasphaera sp.]
MLNAKEREKRKKMLVFLESALNLADVPTAIIYTDNDAVEVTNLNVYTPFGFYTEDMCNQEVFDMVVMMAEMIAKDCKP